MHRFRGFLSAGKRHSRAPHPLAPQQTPAFCHTPTSVPIPAHCICMYRAKTNPAFPHDAHSPLVSAVFAAREYLSFPLSEPTKNHLPFFWHFSIFSDTMQTRRKPPAGSFLLATGYRVSHSTYFTSGRLAAAADWPTRRVFSSGASGRKATPGYSSSTTRDATSMMISPPLPDITRPIICTCLMS